MRSCLVTIAIGALVVVAVAAMVVALLPERCAMPPGCRWIGP